MHSRLSTSMTPIPMISSPRLYSPAQPDRKYPVYGVSLSDFYIGRVNGYSLPAAGEVFPDKVPVE